MFAEREGVTDHDYIFAAAWHALRRSREALGQR
jgi:hypothetical protein